MECRHCLSNARAFKWISWHAWRPRDGIQPNASDTNDQLLAPCWKRNYWKCWHFIWPVASGRCVNWCNLRLNEQRTAAFILPAIFGIFCLFLAFWMAWTITAIEKNIGFITKQRQQINYIHSLWKNRVVWSFFSRSIATMATVGTKIGGFLKCAQ